MAGVSISYGCAYSCFASATMSALCQVFVVFLSMRAAVHGYSFASGNNSADADDTVVCIFPNETAAGVGASKLNQAFDAAYSHFHSR